MYLSVHWLERKQSYHQTAEAPLRTAQRGNGVCGVRQRADEDTALTSKHGNTHGMSLQWQERPLDLQVELLRLETAHPHNAGLNWKLEKDTRNVERKGQKINKNV